MIVYVVTPSLNKSFKFQSDWPYNNSQSYLISSLLEDITNDSNKTYEETTDGCIITTKVNYPNNQKLVSQKIYIDKNNDIKKVEVLDVNNNVQIKMEFNKIDFNSEFKDDYFKLNTLITETKKEDNTNKEDDTNKENSDKNEENKDTKETAVLEDIIYPMYLPENTYLSTKEKVDIDDGERLILTFDGDSSFMLIEETVSLSEEHEIIPTYGDLELMSDSIAVVNDNSVNWISNGIEYYVISDVISKSELLDVARSISVLPVSK